jgi:hypothetical protein
MIYTHDLNSGPGVRIRSKRGAAYFRNHLPA